MSARARGGLAPAAVWVIAAALSVLDGRLVAGFPASLAVGLIAALLLGNLADRTRGRLGLLVALAGAAVVVADDPRHDAGEFLAIPMLVTVAWLAGSALRERSESAAAAEARARMLARERDAREQIAVAEERTRIARELHDVLGHALSVTVLQVGGVRRRIADACPAEAESLAATERAATEALGEIRVLVTKMRGRRGEAAGDRPGLARLDPIVAQVRAAGLAVDLRTEGRRRPVPAPVDLVATRVVQEALTNVLRHARATRAEVTIQYRERELALAVTDDGVGADASRSLGNGLRGLRERVEPLGGELVVGPAPERGFRVSAHLPLGPIRPRRRGVRARAVPTPR